MDPVFEIMTRQIPDADGNVWVPRRDKRIVLQGPVSVPAFFHALHHAKGVTVLPCAV